MSDAEANELMDDHRQPGTSSGEAAPTTPPPQESRRRRIECMDETPPKVCAKRGKGRATSREDEARWKKVDEVLEADTLATRIKALRKQQDQARAARQQLAREIRNTNRKQSRLRKRTRLMTDDDLLQVLMMRKTARDESKEKVSQVSESSSSACKPQLNT